MPFLPLRSSGIRLNDICKERNKSKLGKSEMKRPREIDRLLKKRYVPRSVYYFTSGRKLRKSREINIFAENPYRIRSDSVGPTHDMHAEHQRLQERNRVLHKRPGYNRPTLKSSYNIDISERLHIPEGKAIPAMTDEAPRFFRSVEGRPVKEEFRKSKYLSDLRNAFYANYKTSVIKTRILHEDALKREELNKLEERVRLQEQSYYGYETFLHIDHTTAQEALNSMEAHKAYSKELLEELVTIAGKHRKLVLEMYVLEEKWRYYKVLQGFLYRISPYSWRRKYDFIYFKRVNGSFVQYREFSDVYNRYRLASTGTVASLDSLLELYIEDVETQEVPRLCLSSLGEIEAAFHHLEFMSMNLAVQNELLYIPLNYMLETVAAARIAFDCEITHLQDQMDYLKKEIQWKIMKTDENKIRVYKDLHGPMTKLLSLPNLYMHLYLELAYMYTVSKYASDQTMIRLGVAIHKRYNQLMRRMERVNGRIIEVAERRYYAQKEKTWKKATRAKQEYRRCERIIYRFNVAFAPIFVKQGKTLSKRSIPAEDPIPPSPPPLVLTKEQEEYLTYFTDYYAPTDDPRRYLQNM